MRSPCNDTIIVVTARKILHAFKTRNRVFPTRVDNQLSFMNKKTTLLFCAPALNSSDYLAKKHAILGGAESASWQFRMKEISMEGMRLVHSGDDWAHARPPCSKDMTGFLEHNEKIVSWVQPVLYLCFYGRGKPNSLFLSYRSGAGWTTKSPSCASTGRTFD
jgi:hypothetical protein